MISGYVSAWAQMTVNLRERRAQVSWTKDNDDMLLCCIRLLKVQCYNKVIVLQWKPSGMNRDRADNVGF